MVRIQYKYNKKDFIRLYIKIEAIEVWKITAQEY